MDTHDKNWFILTFMNMLEDYDEEELGILWEAFASYQLDFISSVCDAMYNAGYQACVEDNM